MDHADIYMSWEVRNVARRDVGMRDGVDVGTEAELPIKLPVIFSFSIY